MVVVRQFHEGRIIAGWAARQDLLATGMTGMHAGFDGLAAERQWALKDPVQWTHMSLLRAGNEAWARCRGGTATACTAAAATASQGRRSWQAHGGNLFSDRHGQLNGATPRLGAMSATAGCRAARQPY